MTNKNDFLMPLLMAEHDEKGIWYFTSTYKAAAALGIQNTLLIYRMGKNHRSDGWSFEWVEGCDVIYKYINPEKI